MAEISEQQVKLEDNLPVLLERITKYEAIVKSNSDKINQLEEELKKKDGIIAILKKQLEDQIAEGEKIKAQNAKECEEIAVLKSKTENTLTRAKEMIFEKTKVVKNQELQIDALNQQIVSLKEVVSITKDLLEIRNLEVKQLEIKMQCMEDRIAAEKERQDLMHKKLEHMIRHNGELKREYETQLCLFSALRERYNERELARDVLSNAAEVANGANNDAPPGASNGLNNNIPPDAKVETTSPSNNDITVESTENNVPTEASNNTTEVIAEASNNTAPVVAESSKDTAPVLAEASNNTVPVVVGASKDTAPVLAETSNNTAPVEVSIDANLKSDAVVETPNAEKNNISAEVAINVAPAPTSSGEITPGTGQEPQNQPN